MGLICIYDTETSGLPEYRIPSDDPAQPHLVEISAGLYDADTTELTATFHAIIRPDGWVIAPELTAIHGISHERAMEEGRPEADVVEDFLAFHARADLRVAHNVSFDDRIIRIAVKRYKGADAADLWSAAPARCTAKMATPILKLPPTAAMRAKNMNFPKTPNLSECLKHFFGEDAGDQAHAAGFDRESCARIFFHVLALQPDVPLMPEQKAPRVRAAEASARATASRLAPVAPTTFADMPPRRSGKLAALAADNTPPAAPDDNEVGFL